MSNRYRVFLAGCVVTVLVAAIAAGYAGDNQHRPVTSKNSSPNFDQVINHKPGDNLYPVGLAEQGDISNQQASSNPNSPAIPAPVSPSDNLPNRCVFAENQLNPCVPGCLHQNWPDSTSYCNPCDNNRMEMPCILY